MKVQCPGCNAVFFSPTIFEGQEKPCAHCGHLFTRNADAEIVEQQQVKQNITSHETINRPVAIIPEAKHIHDNLDSQAQRSVNVGSFEYAGFWRRVAAHLIDGVILFPAFLLLPAIKKGLMLETLLTTFSFSGMLSISLIGVAFNLIMLAIYVLYFAKMHSSNKQATFGKMVTGIIVIDTNSNRISFGRAIGRFFATCLSGIPLGFGFIMVAFTERKQALHDMVSSTLVVKSNLNSSCKYIRALVKIVLLYLGVALFVFASSYLTYNLKYNRLDKLREPVEQLTEKVTSIFVIPDELGEFEVTDFTNFSRSLRSTENIISTYSWSVDKVHTKKWNDMSDDEKARYLIFKNSVVELLTSGIGRLDGNFEVKENEYTGGENGNWKSPEAKNSWRVDYSFNPEGLGKQTPEISISINYYQVE